MGNRLNLLVTMVVVGTLSASGFCMAQPTVISGFTIESFANTTDPFHLAFAADGTLFVGNTGEPTARITRISADGSTVEAFGDFVSDPDGVVVDIAGAVATLGPGSVLVGGGKSIREISPDGLTTQVLVAGAGPALDNPQQMIFDGSDLLWGNCAGGHGTVGYLVAGVAQVLATPAPGFCVGGIASASGTEVFVSTFGAGGDVRELNGTILAGGLQSPDALAFDTIGRFGNQLYILERGNAQIQRLDPGSGSLEVFASGFSDPLGLAFGPDGNLYVSDNGTGEILCIRSPAAVAMIPTLSEGAMAILIGLIFAAAMLKIRRNSFGKMASPGR